MIGNGHQHFGPSGRAVDIEWQSHDEVVVLRAIEPDSIKRRFLVFISAPGTLHEYNSVFEGRSEYDIATRFYSKPSEISTLYQNSEYLLTGGLSKFDSAKKFLETQRLVDAYDGFLFLDADLKFDMGAIDTLLQWAEKYDFDLCQASLTERSSSYWNICYQCGGFDFRITNFVEVMAPYFSSQALKQVIGTFSESISSYGLDFAWPKMLQGFKIGILDAVQMSHEDRVDKKNGSFYVYLKSIGVDPIFEKEAIFRKYNVTKKDKPKNKQAVRIFETAGEELCMSLDLSRSTRFVSSLLSLLIKIFGAQTLSRAMLARGVLKKLN